MKKLTPQEWCFLVDMCYGTSITMALKDHNEFFSLDDLIKKLESNWDTALGSK